jgi:outer membrane protein TolC
VAAQFHASDAVFQPKIAGYAASARSAAATATTNDTLLATALAYLDLLRATQQLRIAEETRKQAAELADLTDSFARTGQGPQADADRLETELTGRRIEVARAREQARVASARLAELLSFDPSLEIRPQEPTIVPVDLVSQELPTAELVATGLTNRPELAAARSLVCEAVNRYRREKYAPLMPSVLLGISQSGFGGGLGSNIDNYRGRFDFDAVVWWELRNFGFGERARRDEVSAGYDQAVANKVSLLDRVAREVVEADTQVRARRGQIDIAESGVRSATVSYQRNLARIRQGQGLPIEALQSLQALDTAQREYLRSLADYNEAQFQLQRALGWPIQTLVPAEEITSAFVGGKLG